jgi:hypothetical protein
MNDMMKLCVTVCCTCSFTCITDTTGMNCLFVSLALQPSAGYDHLVPRGFLISHNDAPQSVELLWTSDQLVAETST